MPQWTRRGSFPLSSSAPKPSRSAAPGARFCTKTSAPRTRRRSTSLAPSSLRFSVRDSLERLSQTKWLARPFTVVSYPRAKSPTSGRSTFITRAPRSASWRVAKGAATACSRETTVTPSSGSILKRPRQAEHVFSYVREDKVGGDGRHLEEPGLAELALDVVLGVEAVAAEGLHRGVRGLPGGVGGQQQGHVGLGAAGLARVEQFGCSKAHEVGGLHAYVCPCYGELDALVLAYLAAEDEALRGAAGCTVHEPPPVADALGGDEDPLGVHAVEDIAEALALLTDQAVRRYAQVLEEELVGLIVDHHAPGFYCKAIPYGLAQVKDKDRESLGLALHLIARGGPGQQDHVVGVLHARDVDLAPVDYVMIPIGASHGGRPQGGRVGSGLRLRYAEGLQAELAAGDLGQIFLFFLLGAVPQQGSHRVHLRVSRLRVSAGAVYLFEDDRGLGEAQAHPPVLLGYERAEVAGFGHRPDELLRVLAFGIEFAPVAVRELRADLPHALPELLARHSGIHLVLLARTRSLLADGYPPEPPSKTSTVGSMPSAPVTSRHASKPVWKATIPASGMAISIASRISSLLRPRSNATLMWLAMSPLLACMTVRLTMKINSFVLRSSLLS